MTIDQLLLNPLLDLPKDWRREGFSSYYDFVMKTCAAYVDMIRQLDSVLVGERTSQVLQRKEGGAVDVPNNVLIQHAVSNLRDAIRDGILRYFNAGSHHAAYQAFRKGFDAQDIHEAMYFATSYLRVLPLTSEHIFYRMRSARERLTTRQMFHIPFDKRKLIRIQRYSIEGFPCLYAASSVWLAHKELRAKSWDNIQVSKLRTVPNDKEPLVLLDLRNQVQAIRARYVGHPELYDGRLIQFLVTWLLVMVTSMPIDDENGFHEEYVISKLLLECVHGGPRSERLFSGIAYSSSRLVLGEDPTANYNIVLPVDQSSGKGLCNMLTTQLRISPPVSTAQLAVPSTQDTEIAHQLELVLQGQRFLHLTPEQ